MNTATKISLIGAAALAAAPIAFFLTPSTVVNPPPIIATFPGPNFSGAPNDWLWVESSTDLVHWNFEPGTLDTNNHFTVHTAGRPNLFFRWVGQPL